MLANNVNKKIYQPYFCRDSFIEDKSEIPGPEYYSKELKIKKKILSIIKNMKNKNWKNKNLSKKITMTNYRKIQLFSDRIKAEGKFMVKSKSMEDLGPTTYFIEPNKKPEILKL